MEIFNTLMMIFIGLIAVNVVLNVALWHSTRSKQFGVLSGYWIATLLAFSIQKKLAVNSSPLIHALGIIPMNFFVHGTLNALYSDMMEIKFSYVKYLIAPVSAAIGILILYALKFPDFALFFPLTFFHSSIYYTVVFKAVRKHGSRMSFIQKMITVLMLTFATHLFTYVFFQRDLSLLTIGFAVALALMTAISILFPAALYEKIAVENQRLTNEIELNAKLAQSAKMVALGEMAQGMAHEINNPLMIVLLMIDRARLTVAEKNFDDVPMQLDRIQKAAIRVSKIVNGLMKFSNANEKEEISQVSAQDLINETLELCSEKIKRSEIDLQLDMPENALTFSGQKTQLSQALLNIISNAFDATENAEKKWIKIEIRDLNDKILFSVTDSGPGFSKEAKSKMFQPFFTTKDIGKGTGLGLAAAKGIVDRHKGYLFLDTSSANTKVSIIIPKNPA